jgi:hypothetical protein
VPQGLRWVQAGLQPGSHDLLGDAGATLRFEPKPAITWAYTNRRRARGAMGPGHWDLWIERRGIAGLLGTRASVLMSGTDVGMLIASAYFMKGTLELMTGHRYLWDGGMARSASAFRDHDGKVLLQFEPGSLLERVNTYLDVQPEAARLSDWPLLAVLGLYLRLAMLKVFRQ